MIKIILLLVISYTIPLIGIFINDLTFKYCFILITNFVFVILFLMSSVKYIIELYKS